MSHYISISSKKFDKFVIKEISGNTDQDLDAAKKLCEDLLDSIKIEVESGRLRYSTDSTQLPSYNQYIVTLPEEARSSIARICTQYVHYNPPVPAMVPQLSKPPPPRRHANMGPNAGFNAYPNGNNQQYYQGGY